MLFAVLAQLALMTIIARLHERPWIIAAAALAGGAATVLLAQFVLMPKWGPAGAAWASGIGVYAGAGAVTTAYFLAARLRLSASTLLVLAAPIILILPPLPLALALATLIALAATTPAIFTHEEKRTLHQSARQLMRRQ
jgi:hypothetical protein